MTRLPLTFGTGVAGSTFDEALAAATLAEDAGFDHISFSDRPQAPGLDGWTLATAIAARTGRIRLFHSTLNLPYRYPQLLAKQAASLDVISGGRLDLCLGAGGTIMTPDYDAYGIPMRAPGERLEVLAEAIGLMRALWTESKVTFEGTYYHVKDAVCDPKPAQGLIPIWTGAGAGRPRGLRIAGRLGDGLIKNQGWGSIDDVKAMRATVTAAATRAGRDPDAFRFVLGGQAFVAATTEESAAYRRDNPNAAGLIGTPDEILATIAAYRTAGVDTFMVRPAPGPGQAALLQRFAREIIPAAKGMSLA